MRRLFCSMVVGAVMVAGCGREGPIGERAMRAYKAHDYKAALPLLKKWAGTAEVMGDRERLKNVMAYIVDSQIKTGEVVLAPATNSAATGKPVAATQTGGAAGSGVAAVPSFSSLQAQAAAVANQAAGGYGPVPPEEATGAARIVHKPIAPGEVRAMTIKAMGNFEFDPERDSDVPADVKALSGGKVRLKGFMLPLTQADRVTDFALVPSLVGCCFGQPPGTQHIVTCRIPKSKAMEYVTDEISVEGILRVDVKREQGYTNSIFELDVTSVKLAQ